METQGKLKAWCSSKWRGMMKMQRLERGVGPIGSFFSGSQYLVQLSTMSSRPCYSPGGGRINLKGEGTLCYSITYFLKTAKCWTPTKSLTFKKKELLPPKYFKRPNGLLKCGILSEHCNDTGAWKSGRGLWRQLPLLGVRMEGQVCLRSSGGVTSLCPPSSFSINPCCPLLPALFPP